MSGATDILSVYPRAADPGGAPWPPIVLVHGSMDRAAGFIKVQKRLRDRTVIRYDRRGYGRSRTLPTASPATIDDHVADLLELVGDGAVVIGHSLGGVVALAAAQRAPDRVLAVGAYESPMQWLPWWPKSSVGRVAMEGDPSPEDVAERFLRRLVGDEVWEGLPERTRRERRVDGHALVAELRSLRASAPYSPAELMLPVVAAYGTHSDEHHQRSAQELAALTAGALLVAIDGAGHAAHLSHPDEFCRFVRTVVRRAEERRG